MIFHKLIGSGDWYKTEIVKVLIPLANSSIYFLFRVAAMESISNAITNGQTNGVVVSGPVGSVPANVVTAGGGVAQGKRSFMCLWH